MGLLLIVCMIVSLDFARWTNSLFPTQNVKDDKRDHRVGDKLQINYQMCTFATKHRTPKTTQSYYKCNAKMSIWYLENCFSFFKRNLSCGKYNTNFFKIMIFKTIKLVASCPKRLCYRQTGTEFFIVSPVERVGVTPLHVL